MILLAPSIVDVVLIFAGVLLEFVFALFGVSMY